jgi:exodeoxyribonuclease VII small subunit
MATKKTPTFESALERLDQIVARLDTGEEPLDESLKLFGEGAELVSFCTNALEKARLTVETLFPEPGEQEDDD